MADAAAEGRGRPAVFVPFDRHTSITAVYRASHDLFLAQRFARHVSPLTTTVYKDLHVVVSRRLETRGRRRQIVYLGVHQVYAELDDLMKRFRVTCCVADAMPDPRDPCLGLPHGGRVWLCYFNEHQKGEPRWDAEKRMVQVNRTEAMDISRAALREKRRVLPRRVPPVEELATHVAANAKRLVEDEETGDQRYRYVRSGADHFSLALTCDCLAAARDCGGIFVIGGYYPDARPIMGRKF